MNIIERTRSSGKCPPSLFRDEPKEDLFEGAVAKIIEPNDLVLSSGGSFAEDFEAVMQMTNSSAGVPGNADSATLAQRRCIILAVVGSTPTNSPSLTTVLNAGFLTSVKSWLDDILSGAVGGVDLLLHLLSNIVALPVNKSNVKDSGMGKAIGSIDKHKICAGTPNEAGIKERVSKVKAAWQKSVKLLKEKKSELPVEPSSQLETSKHDLDSNVDVAPASKKARTETDEKKKPSSLSSLLNKVKPGQSSIGKNGSSSSPTASGSQKDDKKKNKRVKWQDHFGGELTRSRTIEGGELQVDEEPVEGGDVSWSDRKKRDRLREKELLSKVKKAKLLDDDDDDMGMDTKSALPPRTTSIPPTTAWRAPAILPTRSDAPPPQVTSTEVASQTARMKSIAQAHYLSPLSVPGSPAPMSDVEQALDMTNQSSTSTQSIPFFVPQVPEPIIAAPIPAPAPADAPPSSNGWSAPAQPTVLPPAPLANAASLEFVQSLGLPMFLVGQDTQALQTLAATPSLLSTFVDSNGMYDQVRLTSLVQTLSQSSKPAAPAAPIGQVGGQGYSQGNMYGVPSTSTYPLAPAPAPSTGSYGGTSSGIYGPASNGSSYGGGGSFGGFKSRSDDGNLHVSGYGPTTSQADLINLFTPYVKVDEVVMKTNFSFVNTSDPAGAARAKESLTGVLLGGLPIRINPATRRAKTGAPPPFAAPQANTASIYGNSGHSVPGLTAPTPAAVGLTATTFPPPNALPQAGNIDISSVRDDRGNPATKNLFVAGYGQGTTEHQLRELFGQYAQILATIVKGSFSFVNTSDRAAAVRAREMLSGTMVNGGVLRINFAKESGRLGTSFDVTYNGAGAPPPPTSHYGRH